MFHSNSEKLGQRGQNIALAWDKTFQLPQDRCLKGTENHIAK